MRDYSAPNDFRVKSDIYGYVILRIKTGRRVPKSEEISDEKGTKIQYFKRKEKNENRQNVKCKQHVWYLIGCTMY